MRPGLSSGHCSLAVACWPSVEGQASGGALLGSRSLPHLSCYCESGQRFENALLRGKCV